MPWRAEKDCNNYKYQIVLVKNYRRKIWDIKTKIKEISLLNELKKNDDDNSIILVMQIKGHN